VRNHSTSKTRSGFVLFASQLGHVPSFHCGPPCVSDSPVVTRRKVSMPMSVTIRSMRPDEARRFLEIHHAAVRDIAAKDYPASVVEVWAPLPITDVTIERFLTNRDHEIRLMAEVDGELVGIGVVVLNESELRACYVVPSAVRRGVGSALVGEIERVAREHGLIDLQLESSLTAEPFYAALGYRVEKRGELVLAPGVPMASVKMRKRLE
jgi:putative acetyltransferase